MSELLAKLKAEQIDARKGGDKVKASVLTTLIGEVSPSGNDTTVDDAKVFKTIKSFRDNALEMAKLRKERGESSSEADREAAIMEDLLPKQLSESELEEVVVQQIEANGIDSMKGMGIIKAYLEEHYKGRYDGKQVAAIVKGKVL